MIIKKMKVKVDESKHITDEHEIWYCNEVLPLKAEISELQQKEYLLLRNWNELKEYLKLLEALYVYPIQTSERINTQKILSKMQEIENKSGGN